MSRRSVRAGHAIIAPDRGIEHPLNPCSIRQLFRRAAALMANATGRTGTLVGLAVLAGCTAYVARPIDPVQTEAAFRQRSFGDPRLQAYIAANAPPDNPTGPGRFGFGALTLVAMFYNPDIQAARDRVGLASAAEIVAGTIPNPAIAIGPSHETGLAGTGFLNSIVGPTFDIPIETAGKRGYRMAQARHLSAARAYDLLNARWSVRGNVRSGLVAYLAATRTLALRQTEESLQSALLALLEKSLAAGQAAAPTVFGARAAVLDARLAAKVAGSAVIDAKSALALALGVPASALDGIAIAWPGFDRLPDSAGVLLDDTRKTGLLDRADLQAALAFYAAAESALQLEVAKQYPDIHLGPSYQYQERANFYTLGFSIPLPVFDQNQGPIAEAAAQRKQAATQFVTLQEHAIQEADRALAQYVGATSALADVDAALTLARRQEHAAQRLFDTGQGDSLSLGAARLQRALTERGRLDALVRAQTALGLLEDAVQRPLGGEAPLPPIPLAPVVDVEGAT